MNDRFYRAAERCLPPSETVAFERVLHERRKPRITRYKIVGIAVIVMALLGLSVGAVSLTKTALEVRKEFVEDRGAESGWSLEDWADYAEAVQDVEPVWLNPSYRKPETDEVSKEEARETAMAALQNAYGLTEEYLERCEYQEYLQYYDADFPEMGSYYKFLWMDHSETALHPGGDLYEAHIDPATGAILLLQSTDDMVG